MPGLSLLFEPIEHGQTLLIGQTPFLASCHLILGLPLLLAMAERVQHIAQPGVELGSPLPSAAFVKLNEEIFNLLVVKLQ